MAITNLNSAIILGVAKVTKETTDKIHNAASMSRAISNEFEGRTFGGQGRVITDLILQMCNFFAEMSQQMAGIDQELRKKQAAIDHLNADTGKYAAVEEFTEQVRAKAKQDFRALATSG
jgi:hypothetical protein